jgi:outer membrane biosynthesis protein TonB
LVKLGGPARGGKLFSIPATRIAEQLGNRIVANIVMLGFFTAVTDILTVEAARKALPTSVPERFVDLNMKAFEQGYEYGLAVARKLPEGGEPAPEGAAAKKAAAEAKPKRAAPGAKSKTKAVKTAATKAKPKKKAAPKKKVAKPKAKKAAAKRKPTKGKTKKAAGGARAKRAAPKSRPKAKAKGASAKSKKRSKPRARKK